LPLSQAIKWAVEHEVDIICLSWTAELTQSDDKYTRLQDLLSRAFTGNIIVFGAIDDTRPEETPIPASLSNAFAIRHVSIDNPVQLPPNELEIVKYLLPGKGIEIKLPRYLDSKGYQVTDQGSSYATAVAAGLASLVLCCGRFALRPEPQPVSGKLLFSHLKKPKVMANIFDSLGVKNPSNYNKKFVRPWHHFPKKLTRTHPNELMCTLESHLRKWSKFDEA
jgi:hypothetical protein